MREFENFSAKTTANLTVSSKTRQRISDEIIEHLREEARLCLEEGMSDEEAAREAIARFGCGETLAGLIEDSLPQERRRYQLLKQAWSMLGVTVGIWCAVAVGAWFTALDDSTSPVGVLPRSIWIAIYAVSSLVALVCLVMLAGLMFREGVQRSVVGGLFVFAAFVVAMFLFETSGLRVYVYIHAGQDEQVTALQMFFMRLYLCWCPTLLIGSGLLIADRNYMTFTKLRLIAEIGLLSAILWGGRILTMSSPWLMPLKWPKLLSTGLMALVFVLLVGVTAGVLGRRAVAPEHRYDVAEA